jgi:SAM-dependent methyltransferase
VNGQPAYQLYLPPYRHFFKSRAILADIYGLDPSKRWIFIPENYRWAFIGNKLKLFTDLGADRDEIMDLKSFCIRSLKLLLQWCNRVGNDEDLCIIFRPRPAVNSQMLQSFFNDHVGKPAPNLLFIKDESVREWILASDVVISSYSTCLIEAAIAGKPAYMLEPIEFPESLLCNWYTYVPRIYNEIEFKHICSSDNLDIGMSQLQSWAKRQMLAAGDPIKNLVCYLQSLVGEQRRKTQENFSKRAKHLNVERSFFNEFTHENDMFDDTHVDTLVDQWKKVLQKCQPNRIRAETGRRIPANRDIINKTMRYADLLSDDAAPTVNALNQLISSLYRKGIWMSSWVGSLPDPPIVTSNFFGRLRRKLGFEASFGAAALKNRKEGPALSRGIAQRLNYRPVPDAADDVRFPWFLYWEIFWVLKVTAPFLKKNARILDGGGSASLFTCYMASIGHEIHSVELNDGLSRHCCNIADAMNWKLYSYNMDLCKMDFPDKYFDIAYSICVFEHLDFDVKQSALAEIARCLKPRGILSITFDYRNPAPGIVGYGKDTRPRNQLKNQEDIERNFLSSGHFELLGNPDFVDHRESQLVHQRFGNTPYTFGALFLRKK